MSERRTKYGNAQTVHQGVVYDSRLEAEVARVLDLLKKQGRIHSYARQVPFLLAPKRGRERAVRYVADFLVSLPAPGTDRARPVLIVEARGHEPPASRLKRRWFVDKYPEVPLRLVRAPDEVIAVVEEQETIFARRSSGGR